MRTIPFAFSILFPVSKKNLPNRQQIELFAPFIKYFQISENHKVGMLPGILADRVALAMLFSVVVSSSVSTTQLPVNWNLMMV